MLLITTLVACLNVGGISASNSPVFGSNLHALPFLLHEEHSLVYAFLPGSYLGYSGSVPNGTKLSGFSG